MLALFLIGFAVLILELACIRWFGATVIFLQFFSNIILVACFLGLSLGCLASRSETDWLARFPRLLMYGVAAAILFALAYESWVGLSIDMTGNTPNEAVFFGSDSRPIDTAGFAIPLELMAGAFFVLVAAMFVGLGQHMGRLLDADGKIEAYSFNIAGSLAGIALFAVLSHLRTPPLAWFTFPIAVAGWLLRREGKLGRDSVAFMSAALVMIFVSGRSPAADIDVTWSPYYRVTHVKPLGAINVNAMPHQMMIPLEDATPVSSLVYLMQADAGGSKLGNVLVIGAGSGNDVSAALLQNADRIDAVEIDPVIRDTGFQHHPDHPYQSPKARSIIQDGRRFLRTAPAASYDLVIYALVDSVVLHSSYSSLRLESFLFTQEAFDDVRRVLKPDGLFVLFNVYRQNWVVQRILDMLEHSFGSKALLLNSPLDLGGAKSDQLGFVSMLAGATAPMLESFSEYGSFRVPKLLGERLASPAGANGFRDSADAPENWLRFEPLAAADTAFTGERATDDWPFLYLHHRSLPIRPYLTGMLVIGAVSFALLRYFSGGPLSFRPRMFFLGAAFMLMETKAVVQLGLIFGSTWVVSSVVFFAVLTLILAANLYARANPELKLGRHYLMLFACLAFSLAVPMEAFLAGGTIWQYVSSSLVTLSPVFFAGVIFARSLAESRDVPRDMAANISGSILGALTEYLSMVLGFKGILCVAGLYYALSWPKRRA